LCGADALARVLVSCGAGIPTRERNDLCGAGILAREFFVCNSEICGVDIPVRDSFSLPTDFSDSPLTSAIPASSG